MSDRIITATEILERRAERSASARVIAGATVHPLPEGVSKLVDVRLLRGGHVVAIDDQQRAWAGHIDADNVMRWTAVTV